jgi:hypothetical protein
MACSGYGTGVDAPALVVELAQTAVRARVEAGELLRY